MLKHTYRLSTTEGDEAEHFLDFPPRSDMQNFLHLYQQGHSILLKRLFSNPDTTLIICETPIHPYVSRNRDVRIPDLMIAFEVDVRRVIEDRGYAINHHGKPPEFVMEVASPTNPDNDVGRKYQDYQSFGIPEYWRFDASGGRWYGAALAGDRLIDGIYQPIPVVHNAAEGMYWGHSQVLGVDICWQAGELLWWDPESETYLATVEDQLDALAEANREAEQERQSRLVAEERIRQLEEELRRRNGQ